MKPIINISTLLRLIPIVLGIYSCSSGNAENKEDPEKLVIGITPSEDADRTYERIDAITSYFSKKLGMEVSHILVSNSSAMIEAMRANKVDVGSGGTFTYLVAAEKAGAEAIIATGVPNGEPNFYRSCLITHPDCPVDNMEDLKAKSAQLTFSWAYPTSTSGHLVPRFNLQQQNIYPKDFKEVFISTSHASAIFTVISKKVDVAAVQMTALTRFIREGRIKESDVKVIWTSDPITPSPVFVRKGLDQKLKKKIQQAYLDMDEDDPKAMEVLNRQRLFKVEYIPVSDSLYQPFREMANQVEGLSLK